MGRHNSSGSNSHQIQYIGPGCYRLTWVVDRHYRTSRIRFPTRYSRDTDEAGAKRFAKRWNVKMPEPVCSGSGEQVRLPYDKARSSRVRIDNVTLPAILHPICNPRWDDDGGNAAAIAMFHIARKGKE